MLDEKKLQKLEKSYSSKPEHKVLRRVLYENDLSTVTKVMERANDNQYQFSIDIKTLPITDQESTGRCWIFSGLNFLREVTAKKYNLDKFELSQNYVAFYDKLEKINYFLEIMDDFLDVDGDDRVLKHLLHNGIQDGGQWQMLVNVIKKYGLVPKEAMPETHPSSHTYYLNSLINLRLRKYAGDVRKNKEKKAELKKEALDELYSLVVSSLGMPPKEFAFEYVDKDGKYHLDQGLTPKSFYDKYIGVDLDEYVSMINSPTNDKPYYNLYTISYLNNVIGGDIIKHLNLPIDEFKKAIVKQLEDGQVVWFGCDCGFFGNRKTGVWDDQTYAIDDVLGLDIEMGKDIMLDYCASAMNHAMVITGVNLVDGKPTKWKIQNSWGDKAGFKGFYLASDTWFDKFVYQAVVNKKYLSEKAVKALSKKVITLKPWDPMGTLAR